MASETSSTLSDQNDQVAIGGWLSSKSSNYLVQSFLGQGSFGTVAKCMRMQDRKTVAIKMMKNKGSLVMQAHAEVAALLRLKTLDSDKCNLIQWYQVFTCKGHICLEFEHLDKSLYDFLKARYFQPLLLKEIRPIVQQLTTALKHLKAIGIMHADLKLENVMLVNHQQEPYRVKLIDFGLASHVSTAMLGSYIQTRPYRAPEIILQHPFTEAIDMWSLGCLAATLYLGSILYPGTSEYDMMRYIVETQGQPPDSLLGLGLKAGRFFRRDKNSTTSFWKLKTPEQYYWETGIQSKETGRLKLSSLYDLMHIWKNNHENPADKVTEMKDRLMFVDMLCGMLELDATKRIKPCQLLEHHFITMQHMASMYPHNSHVRSCFEIMDICQNKTPTFDSGKAMCGSQQQNCPETSGLSPPHSIPPHPCSSSHQTTNPVKAGMKRKLDNEDGTTYETAHLSKRVKSGSHRRNSAAPSTCSSTRGSSTSLQARAAVTTPPAQASPSKICQKQSRIKPGIKRKADGEGVHHHQADSDHYKRSDDYRKRFRTSPAGPSTSSSNSWTQSEVSPRVKRKLAEDADFYEDQKSKRVRKSYTDPSTCRSNCDSAHTSRVQADQRSDPSDHHRHVAHTSTSTQTESRARSGLKRKAADDDDVLDRKRTSDLRTDEEKRSPVW